MEQGSDITADIADACKQYRPTYVPGFTGPEDDGDSPSCRTCEYWGNGRCGAYKRALAGTRSSGQSREN